MLQFLLQNQGNVNFNYANSEMKSIHCEIFLMKFNIIKVLEVFSQMEI
jgi:hypothetical protein